MHYINAVDWISLSSKLFFKQFQVSAIQKLLTICRSGSGQDSVGDGKIFEEGFLILARHAYYMANFHGRFLARNATLREDSPIYPWPVNDIYPNWSCDVVVNDTDDPDEITRIQLKLTRIGRHDHRYRHYIPNRVKLFVNFTQGGSLRKVLGEGLTKLVPFYQGKVIDLREIEQINPNQLFNNPAAVLV